MKNIRKIDRIFLIRVIASVIMIAATVTSVLVSDRLVKSSVTVIGEDVTQTEPVAEEETTEEKTEEIPEEPTENPEEETTDNTGSGTEKTTAGGNSVKNTGTGTTTFTSPTVVKYTGGALPYFEWEKAKALAPNYFGESVFIGDSISLKLKMYDGLPGAYYMCYGSYGTCNALDGVIKANIWNCIPAGRKRVYIMLGMNDLNRVGVDGAANNMAKLCSLIEQNNPGVIIYIQSMTPITGAKNGTNGRILNNANIALYNQRLSGVAASHGWYFVDVASVMYNDQGNLKDEYCSDPGAMGMHFTNAGCSAWCWYLMNHCGDPSWKTEETTTAAPTTTITATPTTTATTTESVTEETSEQVSEDVSEDVSEPVPEPVSEPDEAEG